MCTAQYAEPARLLVVVVTVLLGHSMAKSAACMHNALNQAQGCGAGQGRAGQDTPVPGACSTQLPQGM